MEEKHRRLTQLSVLLGCLNFLAFAFIIFLLAHQQPPLVNTTSVYPAGKDGSSAYQVATANGFTGSELDWLQSLKVKGADGTTQVITVPGKDGINGTDGKNGLDGTPGKDGVDGQDGKTIELRKNPDTGDIEQRYQGQRSWVVLVEKCDYTQCEVDSGL